MKRLFVSAILMVVALGLGTSPMIADPPADPGACQQSCLAYHGLAMRECAVNGSRGCIEFTIEQLHICLAACHE